MKLAVIYLVLLQSMCSLGLPPFQFDLSPLAERALGTSLARVNAQSTGLNLYRVTRSSLKRVIPVGMNVYDLMLSFGIRETVCTKASGSDPNQCQFSAGFFVPTASCSSRVRVFAETSEILSLRCSRGGSSSSSSESNSRELLRMLGMSGQNPFGSRAPAPPTMPVTHDAPPFVPETRGSRPITDTNHAQNGLSNFLE